MKQMYVMGGGQPLNKRAFTLIELLAVIVILAIIALIATPIILNIIEDTKKESEEINAEFYLDAVNQAIARKQLTGEVKSGTYEILEDGNLCYVTNEECIEENKIEVQVEGNPLTTGTIIIGDGGVMSLDTRDVENVDGLIIAEGTIGSKTYNESTGKSTFILKIRFDEVLGDIVANNVVGMLEYDPDKYTFETYYQGLSGIDNFNTGEYSNNKIITMSIQSSDVTVSGPSAYIGYKFSTDNLDAVQESDFTYYIKIGTSEHKNIPVQQKSGTSLSILNYINDEQNYFVAKKSSTYDYVPGDINNDGYIDGMDISYLRQYISGTIDQACKAMDVDGSGEIDLTDLVRFKKFFILTANLEYSTMTDVPGHL